MENLDTGFAKVRKPSKPFPPKKNNKTTPHKTANTQIKYKTQSKPKTVARHIQQHFAL